MWKLTCLLHPQKCCSWWSSPSPWRLRFWCLRSLARSQGSWNVHSVYYFPRKRLKVIFQIPCWQFEISFLNTLSVYNKSFPDTLYKTSRTHFNVSCHFHPFLCILLTAEHLQSQDSWIVSPMIVSVVSHTVCIALSFEYLKFRGAKYDKKLQFFWKNKKKTR